MSTVPGTSRLERTRSRDGHDVLRCLEPGAPMRLHRLGLVLATSLSLMAVAGLVLGAWYFVPVVPEMESDFHLSMTSSIGLIGVVTVLNTARLAWGGRDARPRELLIGVGVTAAMVAFFTVIVGISALVF